MDQILNFTMIHSLLNPFALAHSFPLYFALFYLFSNVLETFGDELVELLLPVHLHLLRHHCERNELMNGCKSKQRNL